MPLGNGDIGLNAWIEPSGELVFYISKTDAWGDNGRLLKVGRVRICTEPRLPTADGQFRQTLRLQDATLVASCGPQDQTTVLRLWVDANQPVIHVTVDSARPLTATAQVELWRTERFMLPSIEVSDVLLNRSKPSGQQGTTIVEPDTVLHDRANQIGWYHHNVKSVGPSITARIQGLSGFERPDPLLGRTFGAIIRAADGKRNDDLSLSSPAAKSHQFGIFVLTEHPATPEQWLAAMERTIADVKKIDFDSRRAAHEQWWSEFWQRSWIHVTSGKSATGPSLIATNSHPVRIGMDQGGQNRFVGEFGRVGLYKSPLSDEEIRRLAATASDQDPAIDAEALYRGRPTEPLTIENSQKWDFATGLTIEAWIKPGNLPGGGGRIVDKITPGGSDGLLLDTHPGHSLRLISEAGVMTAANVLPKGEWSHVAVVFDNREGKTQMFLGGKPLEAANQVIGDDAFVVSRAYALQRFIDACAGRGRYPIKFNGSIFTVPYPGRPGDADYRRWGPGYWWQNTRLPYLSMCGSGDFEMLQPLFTMYGRDLMPLMKYRTRVYCGHDGAFIPECIYFWGEIFSDTYGWQPCDERQDKLQASGWHKWEWVSGPELTWMMLDYFDYTLDEAFLKHTLLPTAHEILTFFDQHYATGDDGKLIMHPSQALETWWDCTNPMPEVAGLQAVTARLLALPENLTAAQQREFWTKFQAKLPDLPIREVDGVKMLAPAERFAGKRNIENPELYAVFPFRLVSFEKPNAALGIEALKRRWDRGHFGWRQDDLFMAYLGLADDARKNLVQRARSKDSRSRFPAFWGPNYDWVPDQDHGGVLMKALQVLLMQTEGDKIYLLPAWPTDWNVDFKLHAPKKTTLEGTVRDGKIVDLKVAPDSRRGDVVLP
jgi:hypothetical protein